MATHQCECTNEKCGDDLCKAAGGLWTDLCEGTCDCDSNASTSSPEVASTNSNSNDTESPSDSAEGDHTGHGSGSGYGGGHGSGHGAGNGAGGGHHGSKKMLPRPDFGKDSAGHARWIVAKSLWTTIATISSTKEGETFGNIRSIADGECFLGSSGLPYFYIPAPDPTAVDIKKDNSITLSFTESALAERVGMDGIPCGGKDAEDPTCAKLSLIGHAIPLEDDVQIELAKKAFEAQHPRASWLANGGGHTGGSYYTLHLHSIMFLRNYGGFAQVSPDEYMNWKPDPSKLPGEEQCEMMAHGLETSDNSFDKAQSQSTPDSYSTHFSVFPIALVILASFIGSFLGNLLAERVGTSWRNRRNLYTVTQSEDTSLTLKVEKAESC